MDYKNLKYELQDGVAKLTLNRPERMNAMDLNLRDEITRVSEAASADDEVKVMVITGAGDRAFCAGADVKNMGEGDGEKPRASAARQEVKNGWNRMILALRNMPKPVIAMINGVAAGGGFGLVLACDIRIASETASFGQVFVNIGLVPDCGSTFFLPRLVGTGKALDLMFSGRVIDAAEAEKIGLVDILVPSGELENTTMDYARNLASKPSYAQAAAKEMVYKGLVSDLQSALDVEADSQAIMMTTEDHVEGVAAFLEKRQGVFKGR